MNCVKCKRSAKCDIIPVTLCLKLDVYFSGPLCRELLPNLPCEGVFAIDAVLRKGPSVNCEAVIWQWQDDRSTWHSYMPIDSKIIEVSIAIRSFLC